MGRTALESEELLREAARHHTLIITEGRVYNPTLSNDKLMLGLLNQFAEYENDARTQWMIGTRFALAKDLAFRIVLPTGLIWGSPDDADFVARLTASGQDSALANHDQHRAMSRRKGKRYFILPFPDREVHDACRKRMETMLATGSLDAVIQMVESDPDYPRPGLIPTTKAIRRFHDRIEVTWLSVTAPHGRAALRKWFTSPALYGTYRFRSLGLLAKAFSATPRDFTVNVPGAFPSFAAPEDEARICAIMDDDRKPWRMGTYVGRRPHLLNVMRCGHLDAHGARCGNGMHAMYQDDGSYNYYSHHCRYGDHSTQHVYGWRLDAEVERILLDTLEPSALRAFMDQIAIDDSAARTRLNGLSAEARILEADIAGAKKALIQAELDDSLDRKKLFADELDEMLRRKQGVERSTEEANANIAQFRTLAAQDRGRLLGLAADLRRLIDLTRESNPDLLRMLTREMVDVVYFDRLNGFVCRVDVVFPGGHTVSRHFVTRRLFVSRAALEYAAGELRAGVPASDIVSALNQAKPKNHQVAWDEERVSAAPYVMEQTEMQPLRKGPHRSIGQIAAEFGVDGRLLMIPTVHGDLGPGYYKDGDLYIRPTDARLHRWVPEIARVVVASAMGWDLEETVTRVDASNRSGMSRAMVTRRARNKSGVGQDASGRLWVREGDIT